MDTSSAGERDGGVPIRGGHCAPGEQPEQRQGEAGKCDNVCARTLTCLLGASPPHQPTNQPTIPPTVLVSQRTTNEDLTHLRNQSITVEVNMARLFNHNVKKKGTGPQQQKRPTFTEKEVVA